MTRLVAATAVALFALTGSAGAGSVTFADPAGDQMPGRPDLTAITISDSAQGTVTFDVAVTGSLADAETELWVYIDTDKALGSSHDACPFGAEFFTYWRPFEGGDYGLMLCNKSYRGWDPVYSARLQVTTSADHYVFTFHRTDLGDITGFSFLVLVPSADIAPNNGKAVYDLGSDVVIPAIGRPEATPAAPVAGKRFTVSFPLTRAETSLPLTGGKLTATPTIRGKVVPHTERISEEVNYSDAQISLPVPKTAKGRTLRVEIIVRVGTESARRAVSFRVR